MAEKIGLRLLVALLIISELSPGFFARLMRPSEIYEHPDDDQVDDEDSRASRKQDYLGDAHSLSGSSISFRDYQRHRQQEREAKALKGKNKAPPNTAQRKREKIDREEWERERYNRQQGEYKAMVDDDREFIKSRKVYRSPNEENGEESLATPNRKAEERGGGADEELEKSRSRENDYSGETEEGDKSSSQGKASVFTLPYNVIGVIVSIIWLINIIFIAWLAFGRESSDSMKIPNSSEFHPPVLTARHRPQPLVVEHKDVSGDNLNVSGISHAQAPGFPIPVTEKTPEFRPISVSLQTTKQQQQQQQHQQLFQQPFQQQQHHQQPTIRYGRQSISSDNRRLAFEDVPAVTSAYTGVRRRFRNRSPSFKFTGHHSSLFDSTLEEKDPERSQSSERERSERLKPKNTYKNPLSEFARYRKFDLRKSHALFEGKDNEIGERIATAGSKSPHHCFRDKLNISHSNTGLNDCQNKSSPSSSRESQNGKKLKNSPRVSQDAATSKVELPSYTPSPKEAGPENHLFKPNEPKDEPASLDFQMYDMNDFASIPVQIREALVCPRGSACKHSHSKFRLIGEKLFVFLKEDCKETSNIKDEAPNNVIQKTFSLKPGLPSKETDNVGKVYEVRLTGDQKHVGLSPIPQDVSTQISSKSLCSPKCKRIMNRVSMATTSTQCQFNSLGDQAQMVEIKNITQTSTVKEVHNEAKGDMLTEKSKNNQGQHTSEIKDEHKHTKVNHINSDENKSVKNVSPGVQEPLMAPPPFGYHIRRDYSSSESTLEVVTNFKLDNFENNGDTANDPNNSLEKERAQGGKKKFLGENKAVKSDDKIVSGKLSESSVKKRNCPRQEATGDGHKEHRRKAKKLMIIGKVNYFKMGLKGENKDGATKPRIGFHKKIQNEIKDGHAVRREKNTHDFSQQKQTSQTKHPLYIDKEHPEYDEKIIDTYKGNKVLDNLKMTNNPSSLSKAFLYLYDSHGSGGRHSKGYRTSKNLRRRSSKIKRSTKDINYNATKLEKHNPALQAQDPSKLLKKVSYPCFIYKPMLKRNGSIQKKGGVHHSTPVNLKILPSCMLNVNTNAGSFEIVCEPELEQQKEDKQTSNTSVQSGDQYFSTSDNPGGQPGDSDVEISQSFSFTEDKDKNDVKQASDAEVKTSGDQPLQIPEVWDDKRQNILQTCNDVTKNRMQRKHTEQNVSDECLKPGDKQTLGQEAAQRKGEQSPNTINRSKKKGKATEEVYIKFESMSKKITTTTLVKDGRKPLIDKFKPDRKQLPSGGDARKALPLPRERYGRKQGVESVRHTKIMRCSDGLPGNAESRLRSKQHSETNLDSLLSAEQPRPTRVPQSCENQSLRPSESENFISSSSRTDATSFVKPVLCNSSKEIPPQESPEFCSLQNEEDTKADLTESLSEKTSAVTVVNLLNSQTCLQSGEVLEIEIEESKEKTKEIRKKTEVPAEKTIMAKVKSPEIQRSPKKREHSASPVSPKTPPCRNSKSNSRSRRRSQSTSPKSKSTDSESRPLNKTKKGTTRARSGGDVSKSSYKNDTGESSRSSKAHRTTSLNGKSPRRKKSMSRSPDYKKKKRSSKKKEHSECRKKTGERSDSKAEKSKKKGDKKKHKAKKSGQSDDGSETESTGSKKNKRRSWSRSRSKSPELRKASQMSTHDSSFVISDHQKFSISIKRNVGSKDAINRRASSTDEHVRNLDRDLPAIQKFKEGMTEGHASAENLTTTSEGQVRIRSAESAPTFTGTVYKAPTKVVHVVSCPKGKKSEKDLQQAEMGWNSSLTSDPNKAGTAKQTPKRNKLKYYVIKAKTNKADGTVSKLKRPSNPTDKADGDSVCSSSDQDVKTDSVSREKSGTGQIKSVQFSESIEDMEASKNDLGCDLMLLQNRPEGDAILQDKEMIIPPGERESQPLERKGKTEKAGERKDALFVKKEAPQRSQSTPPRRKRQPIWLKKASKKPSDQNAVPDEKEKNKTITKTAPCYAPLPSRHMQHSADNLLRNSRLNIPAYYSLKPHGASPKTSTLSASDKKRGVNYNTMINRIFLTAPMNKSTRKMIAKVGSPVDIKEIIEGTPVDALDHYKTVRSPTGLRTARSVPTVACVRPDTLHAGKKKISSEFRVMCQKKMKISKPHESESNRSVCSVDTNDGTVRGGSRNGQTEYDMQISPTFSLSTDIDEAMGIKSKHGLSRFLGPGQTRRREKKSPKKQRQQTGTMEWPLMPNQEVENQADLSRIHFYGDMMECDVLNMGLSWMVQSFFNRLWFLNRPSRAGNGNASGDMSSNQQIVD